MPMHIINTIIADDHRIFVEGLQQLLLTGGNYRFRVIGTAYNGHEALHLIKHRKTEADLLILDLNMPGMDGLEVLESLGSEKKQLKILVLTTHDDPRLIREAIKAGADGYMLKREGAEELFQGINEIMTGNRFFGRGVVLHRAEEKETPVEKLLPRKHLFEDGYILKYNLTKREMEILLLITKAKSNKEIGKTLFISDQTVGVHRKNIMRKLGVTNTAGLIKVAYENSLI
jgi:DNA-binding NarL/FixJ family response regulator